MKLLTTTLLALFILTGCGGGGGGSTTTPPPSSSGGSGSGGGTGSGGATGSGGGTGTVSKTGDLVTTGQFDFGSDYTLNLELAANTDGNKYFVNVCSNFNSTQPIVTDFSSCKIRGFLTDEAQSFELTLSESERDLVAQILPMYQGGVVRTLYFTATGNDQTWRLSN